VSVSAVTADVAADHGLTAEEYAKVVEVLGRTPTFEELGVFGVMWSEHCSYKSSRAWLRQLPTTGPQVIQGPGENAGAVDIGEGLAAVFKIESHNHPSFIEPFQGQPPALVASCATCSQWAPGPSRISMPCASAAWTIRRNHLLRYAIT